MISIPALLSFSVSLAEIRASVITLSVGPRSPVSGDLRFQQVGALSTVYEYSGLEGSNLNYGLSYEFDEAIGTPLSIGPGCIGALNPYGCTWGFQAFSTALTDTTLKVSYNVDYSSNWSQDLSGANANNAVITGLDIEPTVNAVAYSTEQGASGNAFQGIMNTVSANTLNSSIASEGLSGNVVTAISDNTNGAVSYISYSWNKNEGVQFDETIDVTSYDGLLSSANALAEQGYIISAIGGNPQKNIFLIGTKVLGDVLPRSIIMVNPSAGENLTSITSEGYAIVGYIFKLDSSGNVLGDVYLGEK